MKKTLAGTIVLNLFLCALLNVGPARGQETSVTPNAETLTLEPGRPVERQMRGGETHSFRINLTAGQFMRVEVEQSAGFDVAVALSAPDGKQLIELDGKNGVLWREALSWVAESDGAYLLRIKAYSTAANEGSYRIRLTELRAASVADRKRLAAEKAFNEGRRLYEQSPQPPPDAIDRFKAAASSWREIGDKYWEAVALVNLAWTQGDLSRNEDAIASHGQALKLFQEIKDRLGEGKVVNGLGVIYLNAKDYEKARVYYEQALVIRRELKDRRGESVTLVNLGEVYDNLRQYEQAQNYYEQGLAIAGEIKNRENEAFILVRLAAVYNALQKVDRILVSLEQALAIKKELKDQRGELSVLNLLGLYHLNFFQRYDKAQIYFEQTLDMSRKLNDKAGEGEALSNIGLNSMSSLNNCDKAREYFERSLAIKKELKDRNGENRVLGNLATAYLCLGQNEKVREYSEQALAVKEELKDKVSQISLLTGLGSGYSNSGNYEKALGYYEQALVIAQAEKQRVYEVFTLGMLANNYNAMNQPEKARDVYERALVLVKELKHRRTSSVLNGLAGVHVKLKQYDKAKDYYEQSLASAREFGDKVGEVEAFAGMGNFYASLRQFDKAQSYMEQALASAIESKNNYSEVGVLSNLGELYRKSNQFEKALGYHEQVLKYARQTNNISLETFSLHYLANIYSNLNQYDKAQDYYEQALVRSKAMNRILEAIALVSLGNVHFNLNQYEKARDYYEQGLAVAKEAKQRDIEGGAIGQVGSIYADLRQNERARDLYQQSLAMMKELLNRRGEGNIRNALGNTYLNLKQYRKAREYYEQALAIAREVKEKSDEANALINMGMADTNLNQLEKAKGFYEQGLALAREVRSRSSESFALNGLGELYQKLKQHEKAQNYHQQALTIAREIKNRKVEGSAAWNLMKSLNQQGDTVLAIFYGKQAVNAFQSIRGDIKGFDKESQVTFVKDKEQAYRTLADLLISEGRLPEAQIIINLLKEEEYEGVVRSGENPDTIPYGQAEAGVLAKIEALASLGRRRLELLKRQGEGGLSVNDEKELARISEDTRDAIGAFESALSVLKRSEPTASERIAAIESRKNLTNTLENLKYTHNTGIVALYTLIGTEEVKDEKDKAGKLRSKFGWVVLVTPTESKAYPIDVTDLEETVFAFRIALSNNKYNPQPLAQKLYDKLFRQTSVKQKRTLEADLEELLRGFNDRTIMWSLDGMLRYIPMAALHDGKQYLVRKYRNVIFTQQSLPSLNKPDKKWKVLGLGVSEQRENFDALPGVKKELVDLVRQPNETTGILDGTRRLDGDFTKKEALRLWSLGEYPVVHIASHFSFNPVDHKASFLLLGNGRLTFADINNRQGLFNAVDLLTLSACDTAMSSNGKEAEGFAFLAQDLGASTVIASLWKVSDAGTPELMLRFYTLRAENPQMPKGEAFQQAQLSLLGAETTDKSVPPTTKRAELAGGDVMKTKLPLYVADAKKPFAHPYYWSSFVLIGNWK